jgi:GNAT superfamily N-acetyltransferase
VADGPHCGLFCLATRSERRRTGLARAVVATLAAWARDRGAHTLCLEVELRNRPALALYGALGFARRYAYVHRVGRASH